MREFSEELADKPVVVAANKMDLPDSRELFPEFRDALEARGVKVFAVSGATRDGVEDLLKYLSNALKDLKGLDLTAANEEEKLYEFIEPFVIEERGDGRWTVSGPGNRAAGGDDVLHLMRQSLFSSEAAEAWLLMR